MSEQEDSLNGRLEDSDAINRLNLLRKACCHPQILSAQSQSQYEAMSMEHVAIHLQVLKTATESERELCRTLNRLAGFYLSKQDNRVLER